MGRGGRTTKERAGSVVRRTRWAPAQRVRSHRQWCDEDEDVFLDALAATCNVTLACEQADVSHTTVYRQRRLRADFTIKWRAALEQGYAAMEMALVEAANRSLSGELERQPVTVAPMSAETVLKVLQAHRASVMGSGQRTGWKAPIPPLAEVQDGIIRKIEAIRRGRLVGGGEGEGAGEGASAIPTPDPSRSREGGSGCPDEGR